MKKILNTALVCAASVAAAGCSGAVAQEAGHASCDNAASTTEYGVKWQDDLADARHSGKLTMSQAMDAQSKIYGKLGMLKEAKYADYCTFLDSVRQETGF